MVVEGTAMAVQRWRYSDGGQYSCVRRSTVMVREYSGGEGVQWMVGVLQQPWGVQ